MRRQNAAIIWSGTSCRTRRIRFQRKFTKRRTKKEERWRRWIRTLAAAVAGVRLALVPLPRFANSNTAVVSRKRYRLMSNQKKTFFFFPPSYSFHFFFLSLRDSISCSCKLLFILFTSLFFFFRFLRYSVTWLWWFDRCLSIALYSGGLSLDSRWQSWKGWHGSKLYYSDTIYWRWNRKMDVYKCKTVYIGLSGRCLLCIRQWCMYMVKWDGRQSSDDIIIWPFTSTRCVQKNNSLWEREREQQQKKKKKCGGKEQHVCGLVL